MTDKQADSIFGCPEGDYCSTEVFRCGNGEMDLIARHLPPVEEGMSVKIWYADIGSAYVLFDQRSKVIAKYWDDTPIGRGRPSWPERLWSRVKEWWSPLPTMPMTMPALPISTAPANR
jgi:hypothetical protein